MLAKLIEIMSLPGTLGGQLTIISVSIGIIVIIWRVGSAVVEHLQWLELVVIDYAKRTGYPLPEWLLKKHIQVNGNHKKVAESKRAASGRD